METMMTISGYVGHDVEVKKTRAGASLASFRVGSTPRVRTPDGWADAPTTWMTVVCYRHLADNVAQSLRKGDPVVAQGRVRTQTWNDDQGASHERMVLEAASVGHDLIRGTSVFTKAATARPEEIPASEESFSTSDQADGYLSDHGVEEMLAA